MVLVLPENRSCFLKKEGCKGEPESSTGSCLHVGSALAFWWDSTMAAMATELLKWKWHSPKIGNALLLTFLPLPPQSSCLSLLCFKCLCGFVMYFRNTLQSSPQPRGLTCSGFCLSFHTHDKLLCSLLLFGCVIRLPLPRTLYTHSISFPCS